MYKVLANATTTAMVPMEADKPQPILILGTRTFAFELADLISEISSFALAGFVENWEREKCQETLDGYPIWWVDEIAHMALSHQAVCSLATTRRSLFTEQVRALGLSFATIVHPTARVSKTSCLGAGSIVSVGSIIAAHTTLGEHVLVNRGAILGHHIQIGNFVNIQSGCNIGGNTQIGDATYIGMGATVLNNLKIGSHSVIGAGAVVTKDVPDNVQVVGVPAKIVKENIEGL